MFSKRELLEAIDECEKAPKSYQDCEKLATFYILYDHLFTDSSRADSLVGSFGDSDFLRAVDGCSSDRIFAIMDDLMETLKKAQPRLYDCIMTKIKQTK